MRLPTDRLVPEPITVLAFIVLLGGTASLYAVDVFEPSGGLVWVPFHAAVVGLLAAAAVGWLVRRAPAALALAYAPFLGFQLEWGLVEVSARPLAARLAAVVRPDGLAALAVEAAVVGAIGYVVGRIARRAAAAAHGSSPAE